MKSKKETMIQWSLLLWMGMLLLAGCSGRREAVVLGLEPDSGSVSETEPSQGLLPEENALTEGAPEKQTERETIAVYVCGAVKSPGVYELPVNSRIVEAVELAGGFAETADPEWLNLARRLQDGEQVRICTREETDRLKEQGVQDGETAQSGETAQNGKEALVNLNTAGRQELMTLTGIGEAKADAILAYRQEHGGFQTIEEIMEISGIKEAVFLQIKDRITV